jgi:hypothetical protein
MKGLTVKVLEEELCERLENARLKRDFTQSEVNACWY